MRRFVLQKAFQVSAMQTQTELLEVSKKGNPAETGFLYGNSFMCFPVVSSRQLQLYPVLFHSLKTL